MASTQNSVLLYDFAQKYPPIQVKFWQQDGILWLDFDMRAQDIALAPFVSASVGDLLWQGNCFECFCAHAHSYTEINASPTGAYAIYRFDDYRTPQPPRPIALGFVWAYHGDKHYRFGVALDKPIDKIMPACILQYQYRHSQHEHFFAPSHADTPDFHQQAHWLAT